MQRKESGIIRKIQYGLDASVPSLVVQVGSRVAGKEGFVIAEIVEDKNTFWEYGYFEYLIYIAKVSEAPLAEQNKYFWKRYLKKPDMIEFYFQDEIENLFV